jgi:hypothetical protein
MVRGRMARGATPRRLFGDTIVTIAEYLFSPRSPFATIAGTPMNSRLIAVLIPVCALMVFHGRPAHAQESADGMTCGQNLSQPVLAKWMALGGAREFGCPAAPELAAPVSPIGTSAREVKFAQGAILWHGSGSRAGQTFAVSGCMYRLYFQYGGPSGWLGLPTSDPLNTPDGQRQTFEGGVITFQRVDSSCDAEPGVGSAATAAASARIPLDQFFDPSRGDNVAAASTTSVKRALAAQYQRQRTEGYVFSEPAPGLVPLKVYWNEALNAHDEMATAEGERDALGAGYAFDGAQGFIYTDPHPDTRPLKHYSDPSNTHGLVTATPQGEADAAARGYHFVRIEGYVATSP